MSQIKIDHGQKIRDFRVQAGLSQKALAEKLGITQAAISRIELGTSPITLDRAHQLAQAIGCDPSSIDDRLASRKQRKPR